MDQRPIVGASGGGSISRLQARQAAKAVKMARAMEKTARKSTSGLKAGKVVSASIRERYLGHFGIATRRENSSDMKMGRVTKSTAKKSAPK